MHFRDYSAPLNVKVRSAPAASAPRPPVPAWRSVVWVVIRQDTGGQVKIDVRMPHRMVGLNGTTIRGLHTGILLAATAHCPKTV